MIRELAAGLAAGVASATFGPPDRPEVPTAHRAPARPLLMPCPSCGRMCEWGWDWDSAGGGTAYFGIVCPCGGGAS